MPLAVSLPPSYKHFNEIMLYNNNDTLSFDDVNANLLSQENFDLEVRSNDKAKSVSVRGRTCEKEGANRRNNKSKSRGHKSNKLFKY